MSNVGRRDYVPKKHLKMWDRTLDGTASPREAIKVRCLLCVGWEREEVTRCTCTGCPLYLYRPFQDSANSLTEPLDEPTTDDPNSEAA